MKITNKKSGKLLTQLTLMCLKYIKRIFNPNAVWYMQSFLDTLAVILRKKNEIVGENFFPAPEMRLVDFIEILGNRCSNTNID